MVHLWRCWPVISWLEYISQQHQITVITWQSCRWGDISWRYYEPVPVSSLSARRNALICAYVHGALSGWSQLRYSAICSALWLRWVLTICCTASICVSIDSRLPTRLLNSALERAFCSRQLHKPQVTVCIDCFTWSSLSFHYYLLFLCSLCRAGVKCSTVIIILSFLFTSLLHALCLQVFNPLTPTVENHIKHPVSGLSRHL